MDVQETTPDRTELRKPRYGWRRACTQLLFLVALGVLGSLCAHVWIHRVDLFVLPARWNELLELQARLPPNDRKGQEELDARVKAWLLLQRPEPESDHFIIDPIRTLEGRDAYALINYASLEPWLRVQLVSASGVLIGEPFDVVPEDKGSQNPPVCWEVNESDRAILRADGAEYYGLSFDGRGVVPRGAVIVDGYNAPEDGAVPISFAVSNAVRDWLEADGAPRLDDSAVERLLRSPRHGDIYRGLLEVERLGPGAARLARPLLANPDEDLRARAASVIGNDGSLAKDLVSLLEDPSAKVRTAARLALLAAGDRALARQSWLELIRENYFDLEHVEFDREGLASPEIAEALLDRIERDSIFMHDRSWEALRPEQFRPLISRLEAAWKMPPREDQPQPASSFTEVEARNTLTYLQLEILPWVASVGGARLDALLLQALQADNMVSMPVLSTLLRRSEPLRIEGATDAVRAIARDARSENDERIAAYLLLLQWGLTDVRGELVSLLKLERDPLEHVGYLLSHAPTDMLPDIVDLVLNDGQAPEDDWGVRALLDVLEAKPLAALEPLRDRLVRLEKLLHGRDIAARVDALIQTLGR